MADQIKLLEAHPGYPVGTVLTKDAKGNYRTSDGKFWMSERRVISEESRVIAPLAEPEPRKIERIKESR